MSFREHADELAATCFKQLAEPALLLIPGADPIPTRAMIDLESSDEGHISQGRLIAHLPASVGTVPRGSLLRVGGSDHQVTQELERDEHELVLLLKKAA